MQNRMERGALGIMKTFITILLCALLCSDGFSEKTNVIKKSIDAVYLFPDKYIGKTIIFDKVLMNGKVDTHRGFFLLTVTGTRISKQPRTKGLVAGYTRTVSSLIFRDGFAFRISDGMVEKMLEKEIYSSRRYYARLTCDFKRIPYYDPDYRKNNPEGHLIADVKKIEIYKILDADIGMLGKIVITVSE